MSIGSYKNIVDKIRTCKDPAEKAKLVEQKGEVSAKLFADTKHRKAIKAEIDAINKS